MNIEEGMLFDSVRAAGASTRWKVAKVDYPDIWLTKVGERQGDPPKLLPEQRRTAEWMAQWPLKLLTEKELITAPYKVVHIDTLLRVSDYLPVSEVSSKQKGLFKQ